MRAPLLIASLILAGCLAGTAPAPGSSSAKVALEPHGRPAETREADEAWVVWLHGEETLHLEAGDPRTFCSVAFHHRLDAGNRTLEYLDRGAASPPAARAILVVDVMERPSDCPATSTHVLDAGDARVKVGRFGEVHLQVREDGSLVLNGLPVAQGDAWRATYDAATDEGRSVRGEIRAETLGAWPRANLRPVAGP